MTLLRVILTTLLCWVALWTCGKSAGADYPEIRRVYSADYCSPCHEIKGLLLQHGAKLKVVNVREHPKVVRGLPTCEYKDLQNCTLRDAGGRVRSGEYVLPADNAVEVREVVTK